MIERHRPAFEAGATLNRFQSAVLSRARTFSEFLRNMDEEIVDTDGRKWIFRNQLDYLTDETGSLLVDFVGRTETLARDFDTIRPRLSGPAVGKLPHINRSDHANYTAYYSDADAELVAARYARDIASFGYRFGG